MTMTNDTLMSLPDIEEALQIADDPKNVRREVRRAIGAKLKEARTAQGMTVRSLAEASGVDKSQISRIEGGRANATLDTITAMAAILGLTLDIIAKP